MDDLKAMYEQVRANVVLTKEEMTAVLTLIHGQPREHWGTYVAALGLDGANVHLNTTHP